MDAASLEAEQPRRVVAQDFFSRRGIGHPIGQELKQFAGVAPAFGNMRPVAAPDHATGHGFDDGLRDQPLIMYPRNAGIGLYWKVQELCAKAGFRPRMVQEARDASTIIGLVAAGGGIALVPSDTQCIQLAGVVYRRLLDKEAVSTLHLAYRTAHESAYLRLFLERLRAAPPASRRAGR
ncbi:Ben and cat operon transcriptional regulator [Variovorax sp. SRS16]|nr:Ben and cat operon transcriptional regulator [Variovorax sp. SRS16]